MQIVEKYNPERTYMYPNGEIATPERVKADYPAVELFTHVITTDESHQIIWSMQNLASMASLKNLSGTEDELILALQEDINAPQPEPEPSANERIAAALEFQNLQSM